MSSIKLTVAFSATMFLAACGGGGGGSDTVATPTTPVDPPKTYYTPTAPRTGDTFSFTINRIINGFSLNPAGTKSYTTQTGLIGVDGSIYLNRFDNGYLNLNSLLNKQGELLRQNGCTFSPALAELPAPSYVGQTYSQTSSVTCPSGINYAIGKPISTSNSSTVDAYEPVTITAGKFNTLNISSKQIITLDTGVVSTETNRCWLDVISGVSVKCSGTTHYDFSQVKSQFKAALAADLAGGTDTFNIELKTIQHASDFPFALTASIDGLAISRVYLTPIEKMPVELELGKSLTLTATDTLSWSITGASTGATPISLTTGTQVITIDGYTVSVSVVGGKVTAKVLSTIGTPSAGFTLTGSSLVNSNQSVAVDVYVGANILVFPNCLGALKFC